MLARASAQTPPKKLAIAHRKVEVSTHAAWRPSGLLATVFPRDSSAEKCARLAATARDNGRRRPALAVERNLLPVGRPRGDAHLPAGRDGCRRGAVARGCNERVRDDCR